MGNPDSGETIMNNMEATINNSPNNSLDHEHLEEDDADAKNKKKSKNLALTKTLINCLAVISLIIVTLLLRSDKIVGVSSYQRGFFCDDLSLRFPLRPETVSTKILIIGTTLFAAFLFATTEYFIIQAKKFHTYTPVQICKRSIQVPTWAGPAGRLMLMYFMGAAANSILTDVAKSVIGWPRPNFLAFCNPNVTCDETNKHAYITDFKCLALSEDKLGDAFKSFPSAHASYAAFVAFFIVFYVHERFAAFPDFKCTLRPLVQLLVLAICLWSALTRIKDFVHHPIDVFAGLLLGAFVAFWTRPFLKDTLNELDLEHKRSLTTYSLK